MPVKHIGILTVCETCGTLNRNDEDTKAIEIVLHSNIIIPFLFIIIQRLNDWKWF